MNPFLKIAYDAGATFAKQSFEGSGALLAKLLPEQDVEYLRSLSAPPTPLAPPASLSDLQRLKQLGPLARLGSKVKNPVVRLAAKLTPRAIDSMAEGPAHEPPTANRL